MTPKHLALASKVPAEALPLLRELREIRDKYEGTRPYSDRFERIYLALLDMGIEVKPGAGIEKTWIAFGPDYVVKIGERAVVEAKRSLANPRSRVIALTVGLDAKITVQERAERVIGGYNSGNEFVPSLEYERGERFTREVERVRVIVARRTGARDLHSWNLAVFSDGWVKAIDFSL